MVTAARLAGAGLMRRFHARHELEVELKGPADFVSEADRESERTLARGLLGAYPRYGFVAEESAPTAPGASSRFVVDPLDGTTNFLHGLPHFAVAVALEREGELVAGLVLDPCLDELFVAERGRGAWLGRQRLHVSEDRDLSRALVGTGIPHANAPSRHRAALAMLRAVMPEVAGIRRLSAAALDLAYIAAGRFEAFYERGLARWDMAAGALLVREAGGRVTDLRGGPSFLAAGEVLATNGRLHARMLKLLGAPGRSGSASPRSRRPRPGGAAPPSRRR